MSANEECEQNAKNTLYRRKTWLKQHKRLLRRKLRIIYIRTKPQPRNLVTHTYRT